ncbi:MAG: GNAT family N-acetyltransferase [Leucobacter sp.]
MTEQLTQRAIERWNARDRALDAQLPERGVSADAVVSADADAVAAGGVDGTADGARDAELFLAVTDGAAAAGVSRYASCAPDSFDALWGALRRDELEPRWDGHAGALEQVLDRWIAVAGERLRSAADPEPDWERALKAKVPARDSELTLPLLRRGFALAGVVGIRVGKRGADARAAEERLRAAGCVLRRATAADLQLLTALDLELLTHETRYGEINLRAGAAAGLESGIAARIERDPDWTWIVEQEGDPVGYLSFEIDRPQHRAECAAGGAVAYLDAMFLREHVRGAGIGEAVVNFGHGRAEAAGFERVLLDYAAANPRSGAFWHRMGYRPLWYRWQRRPA